MFSWSSSENIGLDKEALKGLLVEGVGGLISPCILQSWYGMISVVCKIFFETKLCHWLWSRASQLCPLAVGKSCLPDSCGTKKTDTFLCPGSFVILCVLFPGTAGDLRRSARAKCSITLILI